MNKEMAMDIFEAMRGLGYDVRRIGETPTGFYLETTKRTLDPDFDTEIDKFVEENIEATGNDGDFVTSGDLYLRFMESLPDSAGWLKYAARGLTPKRFVYLLRRDYLELKDYRKKRIDGKIVTVFLGIKLTSPEGAPSGDNETAT
jgi:hypothetical protein